MSATGHTAAAGPFDIVVVAASYGGLAASRTLFAALPAAFPVPIVLVLHRETQSDVVARILARRTELAVAVPSPGELPAGGVLYVTPPDQQTLLGPDGTFAFSDAGRCLADPLFESVAFLRGERAIAVVLTGRGDDGAAGARAIKGRGGWVLAQDRASSEAFGMPGSVIATGCADYVLPLPYIVHALVTLTMVPGAADLFGVRLHPSAATA